ncbi:MAG: hypothetical protein JWQ38_2986 [Flavipsychrobacter sp.]|nr:hypothetical protein [Flavipsychrobacter sp.]
MKKLCCFIIIVTCLSACGQSTGNKTLNIAGTVKATATGLLMDEADADMQEIFSQADAEKILGEPAHLSDSSTSTRADTTIFQSSYIANNTDKKSGKTGNIYFMYEQYSNASTAHDLLAYYKTTNEKNGAKSVTGVGDEAWFHTDGQNFYFIMARKGNKMIRMKVNKVTATTSLDAFNTIAKEIVERM